MLHKLRERISIFAIKKPSLTVLISVLILNLALFSLAAAVISYLSPPSLPYTGFWPSVFYTISMILDAGCIQYVISDIGEVSVALIIFCLVTVLAGMIIFTGAVVGYVTNYISNFIENSKSGNRALKVSGHTVILNWNSRASEIVNDLLYTQKRETVVILSSQNSDEISSEIDERISATLKEENALLNARCDGMHGLERILYLIRHRMKNKVTIIVRQGETYSTKQLSDISISQAASIILLAKEYQNEICRFGNRERLEQIEKGNANTVKALVQVAEMTSKDESADDQAIIVEIEDDWTANLVEKIIEHKERLGKCHIIPVYVNRVLGQILSQFSVMPELNTVYSELFSNRGAEFFFKAHKWENDVNSAVRQYMLTHRYAIPLTVLQTKSGNFAYSVSGSSQERERAEELPTPKLSVSVNDTYHIPPKSVIIIGHNSKCRDIMNGFSSFRDEHNFLDREILNITVIDDASNLEKMNWYRDYPYVAKTVSADLFDEKLIKDTIEEAIAHRDGDISLLILSDDNTVTENIDAAALTYLIYVQDIIATHEKNEPGFDRNSIDVIVEILVPKNYDVVHNYNASNVVISNRYISKMVTQVGRKQPLFEFFSDILTYDTAGSVSYDSKELYIKEVTGFFKDGILPPCCTARELIWAVYEATPANNKSVVLGYVNGQEETVLFSGNQDDITVELQPHDKLILFSNH